jgi:pimeloyl-ACP methyl ester carboxylesterase
VANHHLDHPVVIGHSLGGFMAYWLAATEPDLFAGIVSVDGMPFLPAFGHPERTAEEAAPFAKQMTDPMRAGGDVFVQGITQFSHAMISDDKLAEHQIEISVKSDPNSVGEAMYELMTTDIRPELPKIKVRVLIVVAGSGEEVEKAWNEEVAGIPQKTLVYAPGSKHFVMYDKPDILYKAVDEFLAKAW